MKFFSRIVMCLLALLVAAGCASTQVTQQTPMSNPGLARPNRIWVYNFVADPADMPADSSIKGAVAAPSTPPTADQIEGGRRFGALIATDLVADINQMGLTAVQAGPGSTPQPGDGVIRGGGGADDGCVAVAIHGDLSTELRPAASDKGEVHELTRGGVRLIDFYFRDEKIRGPRARLFGVGGFRECGRRRGGAADVHVPGGVQRDALRGVVAHPA